LFRRYEVAGAAHAGPFEDRSFAMVADVKRAGGRTSSGPDPECQPQNVTMSDFPVRYAFNAAWRNLDAWVRKGIAPPRAERLQLLRNLKAFAPDQAFVTDSFGNAQGGVRSTYVDVPTVRWIGAKTGAFRCMFYGYQVKLPVADIRRLYPNHESYVQKVRTRADQLVQQRWLTPTDRDAIVREAEHAAIP